MVGIRFLSFITLIMLLAGLSSKAQKLTGKSESKPVAIYNTDSLKDEIKKYVKDSVERWEIRGEFETREAYNRRVTSENRQKLSRKLERKKRNQLLNSIIQLQVEQIDYDPDNETYLIDFYHVKPIYLNVPNTYEAKSLMRNADDLEFLKPRYTISNDLFALLSLKVMNPATNELYKYHHRKNYVYQNQKIKREFGPINIKIGGSEGVTDLDPGIDLSSDLPTPQKQNREDDYAIVIGNKNYKETKDVKFAHKDALLVKKYLKKVLGFGNVKVLFDAKQKEFNAHFGTKNNHRGKLYNNITHGESEVLIYYSGHGVPNSNAGTDENQTYLLPTNTDPDVVTLGGYSTKTLYQNLSKLPATAKTVILDACFSGARILENRSAPPIIADGQDTLLHDITVLTSSSGRQFSTWYNAKEQGLFTWFFLKSLYHYRETDLNGDGDVTLKEIYTNIKSNKNGIPYYARKLHNERQKPTIKGKNLNNALLTY